MLNHAYNDVNQLEAIQRRGEGREEWMVCNMYLCMLTISRNLPASSKMDPASKDGVRPEQKVRRRDFPAQSNLYRIVLKLSMMSLKDIHFWL